jgi:hypothetical protein
MPTRVSIFLYGRDTQLLETRRWVLERSGARVWSSTEIIGLLQVAGDQQIDLFILCHSLSPEECDNALALAHTRWPQAESLILLAGYCGCHTGASDHVVDTGRGPAYLLETVSKLMGQASERDQCTKGSSRSIHHV